MPPKVSILLVTCERPQYIGRAIASAQTQSFKDWEMVVVDDSKGDETAKVVEGYAAKDARIRYIHRPARGTIAQASNAGLKEARGEYVAILDDDDRWLDVEKLRKQIAFLDEHRDYVGCGGGIVAVDAAGAEKFCALKPQTDEGIRRRALYANPMANATTMFRREAAEQAGRYDESLRQFADWDFWLKLGLYGKLRNFPEYFTTYTMWERGASFSKQREAARAAFRIVHRYRGKYPGYLMGLCFATSYAAYAYLPERLKKFLNAPLSRLKKALFSR
jgi:glycosyltransferase involved in cell wall biosynthesis